MPKTIASMMGKLNRKYSSFRVIQKKVRWERRERGRETEKEVQKEVRQFLGLEVGTSHTPPSWVLRDLLALVCPCKPRTGDSVRVHH
jgi:hypothetical protein